MSFKIEGDKNLVKKLGRLTKSLHSTYVNIMQKSVLYVKKESQDITPVRTGNLRASARSDARSTREGAKGEVWYQADYALPVHERTWTKLISGQHKFLEKSVHRNRGRIASIMADGLKRALRRFST